MSDKMREAYKMRRAKLAGQLIQGEDWPWAYRRAEELLSWSCFEAGWQASRAAVVVDLPQVAGLKTGYEAYERVNAELKAECERLAAENTDIESAAITYIEDMQEAQHENERLTELFKVGMTLDGNLRVYGDWQSVRKAQEILAERDQLKAINFDSAAVLDAAKGEIARLKAENKALRQIISDCATSCGAAVSVECSLEFMGHLPVEIFSVISKLRNALSAGVAMGQGDRS